MRSVVGKLRLALPAGLVGWGSVRDLVQGVGDGRIVGGGEWQRPAWPGASGFRG